MGATPCKYTAPPYSMDPRAARARQWEEMLRPPYPLAWSERHPHLATLFIGLPGVTVVVGIFWLALR